MTNSLNKIILIGNVGKDPDIRKTHEGKEVANFSLATTDRWKDKLSGERRERTEWHKIVVFNINLLHIVKLYVRKGLKLYIEGSVHTRKWVDLENHDRLTTEVVLQNFNSNLILLSNKVVTNNTSDVDVDTLNNNSENSTNTDEIDDEVPF